MKILLILLISSIISLASVGKITSIKGEVYIDRENRQISAKVGSILEVKDQIITKNNSKAILLFNDNMSITVGKDSTLQVQKYIFDTNVVANNKATLRFGKGIFRTITGKLGKLNPRGFMIKTSTATIGIRGSDGVTRVGADGSVQHTTYSGGFVLTSNITGRTVWIPKGTTGRLTKDSIDVLPTTKKELKENTKLIGKAPVIGDSGIEGQEESEKFNEAVEDVAEAVGDAVDEAINVAESVFDVEALTQAQLDEYITVDSFTLSADYLTATSTIDNYMSGSDTYSYSGNIKGIYTDTDNYTYNDTGTITVDIDYASASESVSYEISGLTQGTAFNHNAIADITNTGFTATDPNSYTGSVTGKLYGTSAKVIGGTISLEYNGESFSGNYIGKQAN